MDNVRMAAARDREEIYRIRHDVYAAERHLQRSALPELLRCSNCGFVPLKAGFTAFGHQLLLH